MEVQCIYVVRKTKRVEMKTNPILFLLIIPYIYLTFKYMTAGDWIGYACISFAHFGVMYLGYELYLIREKLNEKK